MPVPLDEFPVHQHPVSFARVGTSDRNFYDRSYFNGHDRTGEIFFISGYGVYPNLGVKDAYFTIRIGDRSFTVRASDALEDDRLEQQVGFYKHEVLEPLNVIRLTGVGDERDGLDIGFDLTWRGSFPAVDEPRHLILQGGTRPFVDAQRFAQVGTWEGEIRVDGRVIEVDPKTWVGSRDRSWGIRPVGEAEPQGRFAAEQGGDYGMYWLYLPIRFDNYALVVIVQEDAYGHRILNEASRIWPASSGRRIEQLGWPRFEIQYRSGTRIPETAVMHLTEPDGKPLDVEFDNLGFISLNCGPGYGADPEWQHGTWKGRGWVDGSNLDYNDDAVKGRIPFSLLDHATRATIGTDVGYGLFEHGVIGAYHPYGFDDFFAVAP